MATISNYKQRGRQARQSTVETDFSSGMQYTNGAVREGFIKTLVNFDLMNDTKVLVPRAGLRTCEFIFPDIGRASVYNADFSSEEISIKFAKECVENNKTYKQFILGEQGELPTEGTIHVLTSENTDIRLSIDDLEGGTFDEKISAWDVPLHDEFSAECSFYSVDLTEIHGVPLAKDTRTSLPVGTFGFNNNFYFIGIGDNPGIKRTVFDATSKSYKFEAVDPVSVSASEAVTLGYNMLQENPYSFDNTCEGL